MTTHDKDKIIAAAKEAGFPEWENTDDPEFLKVIEKLYVVAFQSGAASRDAEVQRLQSALADAEALELGTAERCDQLRAQINVLRDAEIAELVAALKPFGAIDLVESRLPAEFAMLILRARAALAKVRKP